MQNLYCLHIIIFDASINKEFYLVAISSILKSTLSGMSGRAWAGGSRRDLFLWGIHDVAYIKPGDQGMHEIFSADGGRLARVHSRDEALECVRRMDLEPLSAH